MSSNERMSRGLTVLAVVCAMLTTGLVVRRELFQPQAQLASGRKPTPVEDWEAYLAGGQVIGNPAAPIKLIEFSDYECPFCQYFALNTWPAIHREYADRVVLIVRHWPLPRHASARAAAYAAECAAKQARFKEFHQVLFETQDSLGLKPYSALARKADVQDMVEFERCSKSDAPLAAIEDGIKDALAIGAKGTPAFILNGMLLASHPDSIELKALIERELKALQTRPTQ